MFSALLYSVAGVEAQAVDPVAGRITLTMAGEPPSLDSLQATDSESFFVLSHVMEGLAQYDASGNLVPGVASRWRLDAEGATFWLRSDARWSDGSARHRRAVRLRLARSARSGQRRTLCLDTLSAQKCSRHQ